MLPRLLPQCNSGSAAGEATGAPEHTEVIGLEVRLRESESEDRRAPLGLRSARAPAVKAACWRAHRIRQPAARESPAAAPTRH